MKDERKKPLIVGVERSLPPYPFHRKRLEWSAKLPETTIAIRLSRSRFADRYTIELGAQPHDFVNPFYAFDRENVTTYALRGWGERLVPEGMDLTAFDLEQPMEPAERTDRVAAAIASLVPQLMSWSTIEGLRAQASRPSRTHSIHDALKLWYGIVAELPQGSRILRVTEPRRQPP